MGGGPPNKCPECGRGMSPPELEGKTCFGCGYNWEKPGSPGPKDC